MSKMRV